jgi:Protochlamydia outer membrane protein
MKIVVRYLGVIYFLTGWGVFPATVMAAGVQSNGSLSLGYRADSLDWNIDGGSAGPNVLSELEWRDLDILQLKAEIRSINPTGIVFRGNADYGWVLDGVNRDSDYAGDNRSLEFSRSVNDVGGGRVWDISGGLGQIFSVGEDGQWQIIPMVGFSYHQQDLRMRNGNQRVSSLANLQVLDPTATGMPPLGPFPGLNSSYQAAWYGPWLGADVFLDLKESGTAFARLETHWVNYFAEADWNLRSDFAHPVSFEHKSDGQGWVLELGWQEQPSPFYWVWGVSAVVQFWAAEPGIDRTFYSGGGTGVTKLNEVNWSSRSINVTLQKAFAD